MRDDLEYSPTARLGGLRPLVIDRFIATQAAIAVMGAPHSRKSIEPLVGDFVPWLRKAGNDHADAELRRRVLLMVSEGRGGQGWAENEAASKIRKLAEDVYNSIA